MKRIFQSRTAVLLLGAVVGLAVGVAQPILASFNQASSATNTVSAQSASIQVADFDQTTFAATVSGSLDQLNTNAKGLNNDGINHLAGFVDLLHIKDDASASHYTISNQANPPPAGGSNSAALNDNLEVIVWESDPQGAGLAAGSASPGTPSCPATQGRVGSGPQAPTVSRTAWKTLNASGLILPAAGTAIRLCFYLILPISTPASAAGGQVAYDLTITGTA